MMEFNFGGYLRRQNLTTLELIRQVRGRGAPSTIYGLARRPIHKLDLEIIGRLLQGLSRLEGRKVILTDLLEPRPTDHP
ncbi:hypothetical protein CVO96_04520 [Deinococcus koreensis]|uniref:XRE family transcriptional regulator n=1 Tax=Deinococcus koreensis TaxID=2054903 RepID=A0A2K3UW14_9DEIO|nr:hypothetical protein CVO96_04520 [Deinococcus koreensis]